MLKSVRRKSDKSLTNALSRFTFFMNKLSCLEHLSTFSFSTEMSEMMLHRREGKNNTDGQLQSTRTSAFPHSSAHNYAPYFRKLRPVVMPVDEAEKDLKDKQSNFWILG